MRGLGDETKRRGVFEYCRKRADLILLQETHCTKNQENRWCTEWGGKIIFSNGESNARGVAMLINKGIDMKILKTVRDDDGRLLICEIRVEEQTINDM